MKDKVIAAIGKHNVKRVYHFQPKSQVTIETWLTEAELKERLKGFPNVEVYTTVQELFLSSLIYTYVRFVDPEVK